MRRHSKWLWLLLIPLGWFAAFEPRETVVHTAPPMPVRSNDHAAASRLLEQWGLESRRILTAGALFPLPDTDTLLILQRQRGGLTGDQARRLLDWTAGGGRLLVVARALPRGHDQQQAPPRVWRDNDPLLYPLGITAWRTEAPEPRPSAPELIEQYLDAGTLFQRLCVNASADMKEQCENVMCRHHQPWHDSYLATDSGRRRLGLDAGLALRHAQRDDNAPGPDKPLATSVRYQADNPWGRQLLSLTLGDGELLVVTGLDIWQNDQLHWLDHAWWLQRVSRDLRRVWFVQNMDMPPLALWLWRQAWPLITALVVVLALFLWQRIPRQASLLSTRGEVGRDFLDHLKASARFLWRTDNRQTLLQALRRQVEQRLATHPVPSGDSERIRYLARYVDTTDEQMARALRQRPDTREELTEFVATLQLLRSRL